MDPKGSFKVHAGEHFAYAEWKDKEAFVNLQASGKTAARSGDLLDETGLVR